MDSVQQEGERKVGPKSDGTGTSWEDRIQWILDRYEDGSRRAMGRKVGLSGQAISAWARGETKPSGEGLAAIVRTYPEVRARWLLTGKGSPEIAAGRADRDGAASAVRDGDGISVDARPEFERAYEAGRRDAVVEMMRMLGELTPIT